VAENRPARILAIGDPDSSLTRERVRFGRDAGYEMHWYAPAVADYWQRPIDFEVEGVNCHSFRSRWIPKLGALIEIVFLRRLLGELSPSLVHVFMAYPRLYNLILAQKTPVIVTVMGADILPEQGYNTPRRRLLTRALLRRASCITSKSKYLDEALISIGVRRELIRRVTWGIDATFFRPGLDVDDLRAKLHISDEDIVFFSPRACQRFYRHDHILRSFVRFTRSRPEPSVLLISLANEELGYGEELRASANRLGVTKRIRFVGPLDHGEMPAYYNLALASLAVPPSDGMPQSLYESIACECFPILGNLPQYHELVSHTKEGFFVELESEEELANAMEWVVENRESINANGPAGRRRVLEIADKRRQAAIVEGLYRDLISG
jgi:glycosyltransferase involved in cell wall biosynthesis